MRAKNVLAVKLASWLVRGAGSSEVWKEVKAARGSLDAFEREE